MSSSFAPCSKPSVEAESTMPGYEISLVSTRSAPALCYADFATADYSKCMLQERRAITSWQSHNHKSSRQAEGRALSLSWTGADHH